ncbi:MAG: hypothetical protein K0R60_130 [Microbacterium sp.]|jgi:hypothetical protein|nr:hypothetical protein [Microbacterium sp.]
MSHRHRLTCLSCERPFEAVRRDALTCSVACRKRRSAERRALAAARVAELLARQTVTVRHGIDLGSLDPVADDLAAIEREVFALNLAA